jgi:hypothetical protein
MTKQSRFLPLFLILVITLITFRFMFFMSFIRSQKSEFRHQLVKTNNSQITEIEFENSELYADGNGFEWKENNTELIINGVYHEVLGVKKINNRSKVSVIPDTAENALFQTYFGVHKAQQFNFEHLVKLLLSITYLNCNFKLEIKTYLIKKAVANFTVLFSKNNFTLNLIKPPEAM